MSQMEPVKNVMDPHVNPEEQSSVAGCRTTEDSELSNTDAEAQQLPHQDAEVSQASHADTEASQHFSKEADTTHLPHEESEAPELSHNDAEALQLSHKKAEALELSRKNAEVPELSHKNAEALRVSHSDAEAPELSHNDAEALQLSHKNVEALELSHKNAEALAPSHNYAKAPELSHKNAEALQLSHNNAEALELSHKRAEALELYHKEAPEPSSTEFILLARKILSQAEVDALEPSRMEAGRLALMGPELLQQLDELESRPPSGDYTWDPDYIASIASILEKIDSFLEDHVWGRGDEELFQSLGVLSRILTWMVDHGHPPSSHVSWKVSLSECLRQMRDLLDTSDDDSEATSTASSQADSLRSFIEGVNKDLQDFNMYSASSQL